MPTLTPLSTILNRMDAWQQVSKMEEQYKVRFLDSALRALRRQIQFPWTLQKGTLRVFDGVLEYPVASDHDALAYLDRNGDDTTLTYGDRARFRFTSLQQFYEDLDYRNDLAEIWNGNTRYLGVRYKLQNPSSVLLNNAETASDWTASGTASSPTLDQVLFKEGNGSIRFSVTAGQATMKNILTTNQNDPNYKRKYHFKWIYLAAVPTSITLRYHIDSGNYLQTTGITTQFSGAPLKANDWNLVAQDLNAATATGTIGTNPTFTYEEFDLVGATAGTYYVDASYVRAWELLDYWYYSIYNVATVGNTTANQEYFYNSSEVYSTDSQIIGDSQYVDCAMYDAILNIFGDQKDTPDFARVSGLRNDAWGLLMRDYPSMKPVIVTQRFIFETDYYSEEGVE